MKTKIKIWRSGSLEKLGDYRFLSDEHGNEPIIATDIPEKIR